MEINECSGEVTSICISWDYKLLQHPTLKQLQPPTTTTRVDGSGVTWGDARYGGDSRAVQSELNDAQQIQACDHALAAILGD